MSEDRFDELLREAARDYHRPPTPPREALWARIEAERRAREAEHRRPSTGGTPWWRWGIGMAAVLAVGIGIGRLSLREQAVAPAAALSPGGDSSRGAPDARPTVLADAPAATEPVDVDPAVPAPVLARRPVQRRPAAPQPGPERGAPANRLYRFAAVQALSQAEMLLTSLRIGPQGDRADAQLAAWARDVLSTTRLLLDSPAAGDPQLRSLLEDLELVLAQVAQLARAERGARELELIDQALKQRDVMPRLRMAIPAGPAVIGT